MNILAVDDDELQLAVLSATLVDQGLPPPTTATSADEAIELLSSTLETFDLFLLDIRMPGSDGIELCKRIRSTPGYEGAAVIMLTALTDRQNIERAFAAGATDYVTKPFDKLELLTRIRIAARSNREKVHAERRKRAFTALQQEVFDAAGTSPETAVTILGVPGVVDYLVLSNFMLQLPFTTTVSATAFAVRIRNFERMFYAAGSGSIYQLLATVAQALASNLTGQGYLLAYAGSGTFICAAPRYFELPLDEFSSDVQRRLAEVDVYEFYEAEPISLVFGKHQHNAFLSFDRRVGLLLRAAASVGCTQVGGREGSRISDQQVSASGLGLLLRRLIGASNA